ncbi:hypothetical protein CEXT_610361 [Caerostris extrusa]|uniref:Reverse transcriptase/retrotransposon-derived protein RNase H-like domain-containing protein n=1 Tax=Caerostris extrusa TaxID=172846 RepID=A0AAV4RD61_CAEEX|nr:hypothetical protein CEXT_610361 [Caerostris extrusa]
MRNIDSFHRARDAIWKIFDQPLFSKNFTIVTDGKHPIGYCERDRWKGCLALLKPHLAEKESYQQSYKYERVQSAQRKLNPSTLKENEVVFSQKRACTLQ